MKRGTGGSVMLKVFLFWSAGLHCSVSTAIALLMKLWGKCFLNSFLLQQFQNTVFHTFKCVQCEIICNSSLYFSLDLYKVQSLPFNWFVMCHLSTVTAAFEKPYFLYKQQFSYFQGSFQDISYTVVTMSFNNCCIRW